MSLQQPSKLHIQPEANSTTASRRHWLLGTGLGSLALACGVGVGVWRWRTSLPEPTLSIWPMLEALPRQLPNGQQAHTFSPSRLTLINFWASWCPPCVKELPLLDEWHQKWHPQGLTVLGLAIDRLDAVDRFLQTMPLSFPIQVLGPSSISILKVLGNPQGGLPYSLLISDSNHVLDQQLGAVSTADLIRFEKHLKIK